MRKYVTNYYTIFFHLIFLFNGSMSEIECQDKKIKKSEVKLSAFSMKNSTGDWITYFSVKNVLKNTTNAMQLNVNQNVIQCGELNILHIYGLINGVQPDDYLHFELPKFPKVQESIGKQKERLRFQEKKGKNAILVNNGRTAYRKDPRSDDGFYAGLVTNRVLEDDEMFEVQIDHTIDYKRDHGLTIGVTINPPFGIETKPYIFSNEYGTWSLVNSKVMINGSIVKDYPFPLNYLSEKTRIGVARKRNGNLHFYRNGIDMGVAATNLPKHLFGIFDLKYYTVQVSILT